MCIGMRFHLYIFFTMFCVNSFFVVFFFSLCLLMSNCCFSTLVKKWQAGLVDQMTATVFRQSYMTQRHSLFTPINYCAFVFSFALMFANGWFTACDGFMVLLLIDWVIWNSKPLPIPGWAPFHSIYDIGKWWNFIWLDTDSLANKWLEVTWQFLWLYSDWNRPSHDSTRKIFRWLWPDSDSNGLWLWLDKDEWGTSLNITQHQLRQFKLKITSFIPGC